MIGIYKITNKLNNKSYIGQSIHCGKRLDEHYKGDQFIDEVIQIEGIENFTFEILKEVAKKDLSYWEDYYIIKYNTIFPYGYNKRWNCEKVTREKIKESIDRELKQVNSLSKKELNDCITFPCSNEDLKQLKYNDTILAWWMLHFMHTPVQKNEFTYREIAQDIGHSIKTTSNRFQCLLDKKNNKGFLSERQNETKQSIYSLNTLNETQPLDRKTVRKLLEISKNDQNEELIKTLVYLLKKEQQNKVPFNLTVKEILTSFGHSIGHTTAYDRIRSNLDILQEAGIIKFKTEPYNDINGMPPIMYVYWIAKEGRASDEWLGISK